MHTKVVACAALAAALGASSLPAFADSHWSGRGHGPRAEQRGETREERREARQDRREFRQDMRQDRREFRFDMRQDHREFHDRQAHRYVQQPRYVYSQAAYVHSQPRHVYSQPAYVYSQPAYVYSQPRPVYSQPTYVYTQPAYRHYSGPRLVRGDYLPYEYRQPSYAVSNWNAYPGLYAPPYGHQWMNVDGNLVLMAIATGLIANLLLSN